MRRLPFPPPPLRRAMIVVAPLALSASAFAQDALDFPYRDLMPKDETGVSAFLAEHPDYDGRGIRVAIFDTGVDPGAEGMQVTSDGRPKIIDLVDATGSGDVPTTTKAEAEDGKLTGLSGRELTLGDWPNPTGEWRLGLKPAWEIFPSALVTRMKAERKETWDEEQRRLQAAARTALADWDDANPSPTESQILEREELQARIDRLEALAGEDDPGPVFDCVVFHDGEHWRAVIDTDEDGDLVEEKAMRNFRVAQEWSTFDTVSLLNFGVNIYEDGDVLSIVADCGSHGTHVAGIVAANFPDRPELNGMAPGAQIVAVKIGDTRIGSSSLGTGPARGVKAVLDNDCQLVNMSYGGAGPVPDDNHQIDLYENLVYEQGVTFVSSAGNEGPALTTAGDPGATSSCLIGVGAFISGPMMEAQYSLREALPDGQYTWSSCGPAADGWLGPDVSAPGGAIGPVTTWSLQGNALLNGTSMAAPSVAGGIACLMSGMLAEGIPWTPQHIKRGIRSTAVDVEGVEPFALGYGLFRVDRSWNHFTRFRPYAEDGVRFDLSVAARDGARGLYLRDAGDRRGPTEVLVTVNPTFRRKAESRTQVDFQRQFRLSTTASWVEAPRFVHLTSSSKNFRVLVDPRGLPPGAHFAEVLATDVSEPGRGPVFRFPVTAIVPEPLDGTSWSKTVKLEPGEIRRFFLEIPAGATWADLTLKGGKHETDRYAVIHAVQLEPNRTWNTYAMALWNWTSEDEEQVRSFPLLGDRTLEVCIAHYWSSLGDAEFRLELDLHGIVPSESHVMMDGGEFAHRLSLSTPIGRESVKPSAKLTTKRRHLRPIDREIRPLGDRDLLPEEQRTHELILTYELEREEAGEVTLSSALNVNDRFWDTLESGLWMVFDENKRWIATGTDDDVKLDEGKHVVRFHARHQDVSILEGIQDAMLRVEEDLDKPVAVPVLSDPEGALISGHAFGSRTMERGDVATLWLGSPLAKELPKGVSEGDVLLGRVRLRRGRRCAAGSGQAPGRLAAGDDGAGRAEREEGAEGAPRRGRVRGREEGAPVRRAARPRR